MTDTDLTYQKYNMLQVPNIFSFAKELKGMGFPCGLAGK